MVNSILTSTKKTLGLTEDYEAFDPEIVMYINGVFSTLNQLGIGPALGFTIEDKTAEWSTFLGLDLRYDFVKSYMYLRVRLIFDPPATSFAITAIQEQIKELEWRVNVLRESQAWVDPRPLPEDSPNPMAGIVIDGGVG